MQTLVFVGANPGLRRQLEELARVRGLDLIVFPAVEALALDDSPQVLVFELELKGAVDAIAREKQRRPGCLIAGAIRLPVPELWHAAVAAGADLVSNWGALPNQLRQRLEARLAGADLAPRRARLKVMLSPREGDGLVGRLPDAPDGPVVVFRIGQNLCAFRDVCPHDGASLADGALDGRIVTCPRHGSQFNVCTGARLRGPADYPIRTYRVVMEDGATFVEMQ